MCKFLFVLIMILLLSLTGCQSEEGGGSADPPVSGITGSEVTPALDNSSAETSGTEATGSVPESERNHTESSVTESDKSPEPESSISEVTAEPSTKPPAPTKPSQPDAESEPSTPPVTSVPSEPEQTKPDPKPSDPPTESTTPPVDMEREYARIIREATQYAESYAAKGFTFVWDDSLEFGWETGYMGTPRVKYEGVDGVIEMLKYHIDKIVKVATDPGNGLSGYSANYKVVQVTVDGDIAFVVLYG